jgi:hypothetical protein
VVLLQPFIPTAYYLVTLDFKVYQQHDNPSIKSLKKAREVLDGQVGTGQKYRVKAVIGYE